MCRGHFLCSFLGTCSLTRQDCKFAQENLTLGVHVEREVDNTQGGVGACWKKKSGSEKKSGASPSASRAPFSYLTTHHVRTPGLGSLFVFAALCSYGILATCRKENGVGCWAVGSELVLSLRPYPSALGFAYFDLNALPFDF